MFWVARPPRRSALALDCKWTIGSGSRVKNQRFVRSNDDEFWNGTTFLYHHAHHNHPIVFKHREHRTSNSMRFISRRWSAVRPSPTVLGLP